MCVRRMKAKARSTVLWLAILLRVNWRQDEPIKDKRILEYSEAKDVKSVKRADGSAAPATHEFDTLFRRQSRDAETWEVSV